MASGDSSGAAAPADLGALLVPSLQSSPRRPRRSPFHSEYIVFVSLVAGIVPASALFYVQSSRLGARRRGIEIAVVGGLVFLALAAIVVRDPEVLGAAWLRVAAVIHFVYARRRLRAAERAYAWVLGPTKGKFLVPALLAGVIGAAVSFAAAFGLAWVFRR
jgi:hypothetical protein